MKFIEYSQVSKYKVILLDLDNTLYAYDTCHNYALNVVFDYMKDAGDYNNFSDFKRDYDLSRTRTNIDLAGTGASHSRLLYFKNLVEKIKGKTVISYITKLEKWYWDSFLEKMTIFDGVIEFLEKCKNNNQTVCIVTDLTTEIQLRKIDKLGIEKYINYIITSEEVGVEKPHSYIFIKALEKVNSAPKDAIMIGDDLKKDIYGAQNMNIDYIQIV